MLLYTSDDLQAVDWIIRFWNKSFSRLLSLVLQNSEERVHHVSRNCLQRKRHNIEQRSVKFIKTHDIIFELRVCFNKLSKSIQVKIRAP